MCIYIYIYCIHGLLYVIIKLYNCHFPFQQRTIRNKHVCFVKKKEKKYKREKKKNKQSSSSAPLSLRPWEIAFGSANAANSKVFHRRKAPYPSSPSPRNFDVLRLTRFNSPDTNSFLLSPLPLSLVECGSSFHQVALVFSSLSLYLTLFLPPTLFFFLFLTFETSRSKAIINIVRRLFLEWKRLLLIFRGWTMAQRRCNKYFQGCSFRAPPIMLYPRPRKTRSHFHRELWLHE